MDDKDKGKRRKGRCGGYGRKMEEGKENEEEGKRELERDRLRAWNLKEDG